VNALIKPKKLSAGDKVATLSISGGRAGDADMIARYWLGKQRLREVFGLEVIETPNALRGNDFIYKNPKARVEDLHWALMNPSVRGIISNHGGDDSYRLLPYIDFDVIYNNPKVFMGFSDVSTTHNLFTYAGVTSYYGPSLLTPIAQPGRLDDYTAHWMRKVLFCTDTIGRVEPCQSWTPITWKDEKAEDIVWTTNTGYQSLQGRGKVSGRLLGGCSAPMQQIMGTFVFPKAEQWRDSIVFLEFSSPYNSGLAGLHLLRSLTATGMFRQAKGLVCQSMTEEDKQIVSKVLRDEEGLVDLPILVGLDFGHRTPMTTLPIGAMAEIDCEAKTFAILESGVE
jgi:muramoyltetrapeptide carboxypeptidase LdcA involved in peptidoglycan recycling